ncbi:5'-nucleotidase SurE [termite gut metagenome]|uniref:5'-nucleotidase SurE n=1 Tax=termite gut metagenome TaxID=433724 RepID=A0A5J4SWM9_9ZZZZ
METIQKPLILVSNDDGVTAKGINELIKYLQPLGEIVVMAPNSAKSGSGCALSVTTPVQYQLLRQEPGLTIYQCTGTPTDCIKLARNLVLTCEPDLVIGGINHGDNSAINVHYSGTMGIVIEGCINKIPSIGFSFCSHEPDIDFEPTREHIQKIVRKVLEKGLPPLVCLNVNFPDTKKIKGIKVCEQTDGYWEQEWDMCTSQTGSYWLSGMFINTQPDNEKSDRWALSQGYAAITPVKVNLTAYEYLDELQHILCD